MIPAIIVVMYYRQVKSQLEPWLAEMVQNVAYSSLPHLFLGHTLVQPPQQLVTDSRN